MKTGWVQLVILTAIVAVIAVLDHRWASCVASPGRPVIFYDESGVPSEQTPGLSQAEIEEILRQIATRTQDRVWLIRPNPARICVAYIVPDETTPRVRTGRAYRIRKSDEGTSVAPPEQYVQVSLAGHSFTRTLVKPSSSDMPFYSPQVVDANSGDATPMSSDEVVRIVDFVRHEASSSRMLSISRNAENLPILTIGRRGDTVHVMLGFMHYLLWGHGVRVEITCTPTGYKVIKWSRWIS